MAYTVLTARNLIYIRAHSLYIGASSYSIPLMGSWHVEVIPLPAQRRAFTTTIDAGTRILELGMPLYQLRFALTGKLPTWDIRSHFLFSMPSTFTYYFTDH
jgi:hypothetical protein